MTNWLALIEEKENEILEAGKEAYKEALDRRELRYIVELDEDGEVTTWADVAGDNSFHSSTFNGKSIELLHFCFQNFESEVTDETIKKKFEDNELKSLFTEFEAEAEENYSSVECEIVNSDNQQAKDLLEECRNEELDFLVSEFAYDEAMIQLDNIKEQLEREEEYNNGEN